MEQLVVTDVKLECQRAVHTMTAFPESIHAGWKSAANYSGNLFLTRPLTGVD
jgi:hypothetical protein